MYKLYCFLLFVALSKIVAAQTSIIPKPKEMSFSNPGGNFTLNSGTAVIIRSTQYQSSVDYLNNYIQKNFGFKLKQARQAPKGKGVVEIRIKNTKSDIAGAYILDINKNGIQISGDSPASIFYAVQSLIQLFPTIKDASIILPYLHIADEPRFAYRGMHLDVSRHFFSVAFVKNYIDYLALHKMNYFHWHLTDDQGWRIEIKKYPKLTQIGGFRNGTITGHFPGNGNDGKAYGGFYTQEEIRDVVAYAAKRYITVIPEIEMPGHASAALAAYPEYSCFPDENTELPKGTIWSGSQTGKQVQQTWGVFNDVFNPSEETFGFLQDVIDEVIQLFPAKYIHIGGDESPKDNWKRSEFCQQLIKEHHLKDEHGLQSYFVQRMEKYINSKGRKIIGWDEILEGGLAPNATVMSWRGEQGGVEAAKLKHNVIMTPGEYVYFDHSQNKPEDSLTIGGYTTIQKVYAYEPVPKELNAEEGRFILGAQANLWTEYIANEDKVQYQIFPRMAALSEVLWSQKSNRDWADFESRLERQFARYEFWGLNYSKVPFSVISP